MQSGIDTSRLFIAQEREDVTRVDIRPDTANASDKKDFFGADGLSFRDVLDAINPLNHIPIVSDLLADATGHIPSTASRLVGGALLGGPIGLVASLASVIFEDATGSTPSQAVYAALSGEDTAQVAQATSAQAPETTELAALAPASAPEVLNEARAAAAPTASNPVLDLYGGSESAHASYKKAQLLPYLRDVNTSKIL
jgi:hypothetical protein